MKNTLSEKYGSFAEDAARERIDTCYEEIPVAASYCSGKNNGQNIHRK